jgi:hypothetical protein
VTICMLCVHGLVSGEVVSLMRLIAEDSKGMEVRRGHVCESEYGHR